MRPFKLKLLSRIKCFRLTFFFCGCLKYTFLSSIAWINVCAVFLVERSVVLIPDAPVTSHDSITRIWTFLFVALWVKTLLQSRYWRIVHLFRRDNSRWHRANRNAEKKKTCIVMLLFSNHSTVPQTLISISQTDHRHLMRFQQRISYF